MSPQERGHVTAFAASAKPAFSLNKIRPELTGELSEILARGGINLIRAEQYIINSELLLARAENEKEFAKLVGWDFNADVERNVKIGLSGNKKDLFRGFILGFPLSVSLGYQNEQKFPRDKRHLTSQMMGIYTPFGDECYAFRVYPPEGKDAEDVQALIKKVDAKFAALGFVK